MRHEGLIAFLDYELRHGGQLKAAKVTLASHGDLSKMSFKGSIISGSVLEGVLFGSLAGWGVWEGGRVRVTPPPAMLV